MSKQQRYTELVTNRKACHLCDSHGLTNPSACEGGAYDIIAAGTLGRGHNGRGRMKCRLSVSTIKERVSTHVVRARLEGSSAMRLL